MEDPNVGVWIHQLSGTVLQFPQNGFIPQRSGVHLINFDQGLDPRPPDNTHYPYKISFPKKQPIQAVR